MAPPKTDIDLYTDNTPNGHKISCTLEELGLSYKVHHIDISTNKQKEEWFLKINPNGRIPAIVDNTVSPPQRMFEGGAIIQYLCALYDPEHRLSFPANTPEYWETISWLTWMQSGLGPMQGQSNHFFRYAPEKIKYGIDRYQGETKRLYSVIEDRLKEQDGGKEAWLVGGKFSFADLACYSWIKSAGWAGVDLAPFPRLKEWVDRIYARPAIKKGLDVPSKYAPKENTKEAEEHAKHHSDWILKAQKEDQEKHK